MRRRSFHKGLSQQAAEKRAIHLHHVWKIQIEHVADRLFYEWVISTDVENAVAAQKIQIRMVIHVEEICAFGARIDFVETDDALRRHERAVYVPLMQFVVFAKTRGDNLLQIESHEEEILSDSRSKRKSRSHAPVTHQCRFSCKWHRVVATKKAAGFRANPAAQFCEFSFAYSSTITRSTVRRSVGPV